MFHKGQIMKTFLSNFTQKAKYNGHDTLTFEFAKLQYLIELQKFLMTFLLYNLLVLLYGICFSVIFCPMNEYSQENHSHDYSRYNAESII